MNPIPIRTILEQLRWKNDPEKIAIANAVSKYLNTHDPEAVSLLIPFTNPYHLWGLAEMATSDDPDAPALLDFLVLAMGTSSTAFPVVRSKHDYPALPNQSPAEDFVAAFLHHFDPFSKVESQHRTKSIFHYLLDSAARFRVTPLRLAHCLMSGAAMRFRFGWTQFDDESSYFGCGLNVAYSTNVPPATEADFNALDHIVWDLSDPDMLKLLHRQIEGPTCRYGTFAHRFGKLHGALAVLRPHIIDQFLTNATPPQIATLNWLMVVRATDRFDPLAIDYAKSATNANESLRLLVLIDTLRPGTCPADALAKAFDPDTLPDESGMCYLCDHHPDKLPAYLLACITDIPKMADLTEHTLRTTWRTIADHWNDEAKDTALTFATAPLIFTSNYSTGASSLQGILLQGMLEANTPPPREDLQALLSHVLKSIENAPLDSRSKLESRQFLFMAIAEHDPEPFIEELWKLLHDKSKTLRQLAIQGLTKCPQDQVIQPALDLLASKKADLRTSAAELLGKIAASSSIAPLTAALENESSDAARAAIHQALQSCGGSIPKEAFDLDAFLARHTKGLKLPSSSWLDIPKLPPLTTTEGTTLPEIAITLLIAKQSKHKEIAAAPDILPLLAHIDREKSAPFAAALVEGFLNSEQSAADRWALTLGGLLGDKRIINLLFPRIQGWCENSRHKLAEYAAQAISLLPGNEPLMVLDSLSNRYRSKFKNVGRACAEAFTAAATARGITADELGDMVVPDFGFDAEGIRRFDWEGGGISAELGADFKLSWFDPETEKSWKSLPANAPGEVKEEVKSVTKLIREVVKGQTTRLEMSLVRQRRWSVARWKELFENHPLLRSFASGLVWGVYDTHGQLLRSFRRYANGILADAAGGLEELPEADSVVGMIHPLELSPETLNAWRGHFARMKLKQPFPQLARPVETMDPLHGNRREISLTKDRQISAGTFRSRAEKRGWTRGSVVDAGGIASYYKLYPGAGVEVNLPLDGFYIGCDPMETITLSAAYFAKAGSVERGSYIYDEPAPDDPRVLRFDQMTPVVFSETIGDLKAIIATKE